MSSKNKLTFPPGWSEVGFSVRAAHRQCPRHRNGVLYLIQSARGATVQFASTCGCLRRDVKLPVIGETRQVEARYPYCDADGSLLFEMVRYRPKDFGRAGTGGTLYRLPELLATPKDAPVFWVEGEKDVETLRGVGLCAVTTSHGACSYREGYAHHFTGRTVIILPDNDEPGEAYVRTVMLSLRAAGADARIVHLPDLAAKQDVSWWLESRGSLAALLRVCGLPAMPDAGDGSRHGRIERAIMMVLRRTNGTITTDRLPAEVMGLPSERAWNVRANCEIVRYPGVGPEMLKSARATISRALRALQQEGVVVRIGRQVRLPAGKPPMF
jgi:hypothetical protein